MIRFTVPVAVATALVLVVTGCGGSKKSTAGENSGSTSGQTTLTVSSGGSTSTGSTSTGTTSSGSTTTGSTSTGTTSTGTYTTGTTGTTGSGSTTSVSQRCLDFAGTAAKLGQALAAGASVSQNAEGLKTYFNALAAKAPSDIKASFQTLANAISKYVDVIKKLNLKPGKTPSAADLQKVQAAVASIGTADVQAASAKIQAWVKAGCHS